jgi:hypothetical protein
MSFGYVWRRLHQPDRLRRVLLERATEPLHLNLLSLLVWGFGSVRAKIDFDLVVRPQYAFPILYCADLAVKFGVTKVTIIEFGVATGAGLLNMCEIAELVRRATGIQFDVLGFDTGKGLPPPLDYRDRPESYREGDFPMDAERLRSALPSFSRLIIGDIAETVPEFLTETSTAPIGFVAIDVDYYSSTKSCLKVFDSVPGKYLPLVVVYLDDIGSDACSPWSGELLAVNEFNDANAIRKIAPFTLLRSKRVFKNAQWIERTYVAHIHDHPWRTVERPRSGGRKSIANEYIKQRVAVRN